MDDKTYNKQKKRILKFIDKWRAPLGLNWWKIDIEYLRAGFENAIDGEGFRTIAVCNSKWQYLEACIKFDIPAVAGLNDSDLEDVVVHEFMHIFLCEMREYSEERKDHEERVATQLANAFQWLWNHCEKMYTKKKPQPKIKQIDKKQSKKVIKK